MTRTIKEPGRILITKWEGVKLQAYKDKAGKWTWGIGHKQRPGEAIPQSLTQEQVQQIFEEDLEHAAKFIEHFIDVPLSNNHFDALGSLVFNCGFAPLENGLGRVLNRGDYIGCAGHFPLWDKYHDDAGNLVVSEGLLARREEERDLFLTPDALNDDISAHNIIKSNN